MQFCCHHLSHSSMYSQRSVLRTPLPLLSRSKLSRSLSNISSSSSQLCYISNLQALLVRSIALSTMRWFSFLSLFSSLVRSSSTCRCQWYKTRSPILKTIVAIPLAVVVIGSEKRNRGVASLLGWRISRRVLWQWYTGRKRFGWRMFLGYGSYQGRRGTMYRSRLRTQKKIAVLMHNAGTMRPAKARTPNHYNQLGATKFTLIKAMQPHQLMMQTYLLLFCSIAAKREDF